MSEHFARRDVVCSLSEAGWNYGHGRSPFYRYNLADGAAYCIYNRRMMPVSVATSTREEGYWAFRGDVTGLDTGELPTAITGPDAAGLLDRIFTRKVSALRPGRCSYGIACWPDGGILVDGIVVRLAEDCFWYVQADGDLVGWLKAHALDLLAAVVDGGAPEPQSGAGRTGAAPGAFRMVGNPCSAICVDRRSLHSHGKPQACHAGGRSPQQGDCRSPICR